MTVLCDRSGRRYHSAIRCDRCGASAASDHVGAAALRALWNWTPTGSDQDRCPRCQRIALNADPETEHAEGRQRALALRGQCQRPVA